MDIRFSLRSFAALLVASVLTLSLSACDSGGSNDDDSIDNRFSLEITQSETSSAAKATAETVEGFSFFAQGEDPETGNQAFGLYFADDQELSQQGAQNGLFGIVARASNRPGTGSYSVSDSDAGINAGSFVMVLYKDLGASTGTYYVANSGTVNFTSSENDRIEASVDVQATEYTFDQNQLVTNTVSITGSLTAKNAETFLGFAGFTP